VNISRETREIDGFRGRRRRRRRRAYLGVGAEWSRCGWCESSRRSVCWGRRCRTDGNGMRSVFKRKRRGAAVGWEMDGRDGPGRIGQVVVADRRIQGAAWAGSAFESAESVLRTRMGGGSFEF
jgi:hypothetical protein